MYQALDNPKTKAVRVFMMDFSKAFDGGEHSLLSEKLKKAPLNAYIINWLISFLSDRKQRVIHNNVVTEWKNANRGTTQGSVNGPCLLSLLLNNLRLDEHGNFSLIKYAWLMNYQEQLVFSWVGPTGIT